MAIESQQFLYDIDPNRCKGCGTCVAVCPTDSILLETFVARFIPLAMITCIQCGACQSQCPTNAIVEKTKETTIFTEISSSPADQAGSSLSSEVTFPVPL